LMALAGCGQQYWSNGVRPQRHGEARVLLVGRAGAWVPVACYDPDWVRLAGPADCADLIPPGAHVQVIQGENRLLGDRGPAQCPETLAVGFADPQAAGLAVWPPEVVATPVAIDLDADGVAEVIEALGPGARVRRGAAVVGACMP